MEVEQRLRVCSRHLVIALARFRPPRRVRSVLEVRLMLVEGVYLAKYAHVLGAEQ
jgi:hypothetical protein